METKREDHELLRHAARVSAIALVALAAGAPQAATPPMAEGSSDLAAFAAIVSEVAAPETCSGPDTDRFEELADQVWDLAGEQVTTTLVRHPDVSAADLVAAIEELNLATSVAADDADLYALSGSAIPLGIGPPSAWAVAVQWFYAGTFFVVAGSHETGWSVVWRVRDLARNGPPLCDELERWAFSWPGYHDGPFAGHVLPLPASRAGRPRFAVDAAALPSMGLTCPAQLSVWEWTGAEAVPVYFGWYETAWGGPQARVEGDTIVVRTMQQLKSAYVCGSCEESPEATWRLAISPDGVADQGRVAEVRGLPLVDELADRICYGRDASDLATKPVILELRSWLSTQLAFGPELCLGMLSKWRSTPTPSGVRVELETFDCGEATFEITGSGAAARVTAVSVKPPSQVR